MHPNIIIGNAVIPSWYAMLALGAGVAIALGIYSRPGDFALKRPDLAILGILLILAGLVGGRALFIILHFKEYGSGIGAIFSLKGGFAYFGALILSVITIALYAAVKRTRFMALADYILPFLMLSQAFVRIGCLMAGCCYGKPAHMACGIIFKTGDKIARYPTQAYEALLLLAIYVISRLIYQYKSKTAGKTFLAALIMYGVGRFFIEFLRTDSPVVFFNLTLAQISCLALALAALIAALSIRPSKSS